VLDADALIVENPENMLAVSLLESIPEFSSDDAEFILEVVEIPIFGTEIATFFNSSTFLINSCFAYGNTFLLPDDFCKSICNEASP